MRQARSSLPSIIIPCPCSLARMSLRSLKRGEESELQDEIYRCDNCGAELVRTVMPGATA